jgi:hypothetical protein
MLVGEHRPSSGDIVNPRQKGSPREHSSRKKGIAASPRTSVM